MKKFFVNLPFVLFFFLAIASCRSENSSFYRLTNGKIAFWDVLNKEGNDIIGSYSFATDGSCFYYNYKNGTRSVMFDDDVEYPKSWELKNDTILVMLGLNRQVLKFTNDTLYLLNPKLGDTIILIKALGD